MRRALDLEQAVSDFTLEDYHDRRWRACSNPRPEFPASEATCRCVSAECFPVTARRATSSAEVDKRYVQ